jgi:hypothetical protein
MFVRLREGFGGRLKRLYYALVVGMTLAAASAQTSDASGAFSTFQSQATGLIGQWSGVALALCGAWVVAKLGPKFIKRLTSAV